MAYRAAVTTQRVLSLLRGYLRYLRAIELLSGETSATGDSYTYLSFIHLFALLDS